MPFNSPSVSRLVLITTLVVVLRTVAWIVIAVCASAFALNLPGMYLLATGQVRVGDRLFMDDNVMTMMEYWDVVGHTVAVIIVTILFESMGLHFLQKLRANLIRNVGGGP